MSVPSMVDVGRARRLSKRIATIVASAIEFEIKDPPLAFVTITDTKVTGDLHDATAVLHGARQHPRRRAGLRGCGRGAGTRQGHAAHQGRCRHRCAVHPDAGVRPGQGARHRRSRWRSCWPVPARPTPMWRGFGQGPLRQATRTRTVWWGGGAASGRTPTPRTPVTAIDPTTETLGVGRRVDARGAVEVLAAARTVSVVCHVLSRRRHHRRRPGAGAGARPDGHRRRGQFRDAVGPAGVVAAPCPAATCWSRPTPMRRDADLVVTVDIPSINRLGGLRGLRRRAREVLVIDHHKSNSCSAPPTSLTRRRIRPPCWSPNCSTRGSKTIDLDVATACTPG